jgi:preprotein translocase subunit SecF
MVFGAIVGTYSTIGIAAAFIFEYTRIKAIRK